MNVTKLGLAMFGAATVTGFVGVTHAQVLQPVTSQFVVTCGGGPANATVDVTTSTSGEATSDTNYMNAGCRRFVVDMKLPATYPAYYGFLAGAVLVDPMSSQAICEASQMTVHYWRKAAGATTFTSMGGGTTHGVWTANPSMYQSQNCSQAPTFGFIQPKYAAAPGDVWRVDAGAVIQTLPVKVKVSANLMRGPA